MAIKQGEPFCDKRMWSWVAPASRPGLPRGHWAPVAGGRARNAIRVFPPTRDDRRWSIEVDDIELLTVGGKDAGALAFAVAESFARMKDRLVSRVLLDQGFLKVGTRVAWRGWVDVRCPRCALEFGTGLVRRRTFRRT